MFFEQALNAIWLGLGILALASTIRVRLLIRREKPCAGSRTTPAWLHVCGVGLIVVALFPYISATDDVLRIQDLTLEHSHHQPLNSSHNELVRLYEAMDSPIISTVPKIALVLFFISIVLTPMVSVVNRVQPSASGRSPPLAAIS